MMRRSLLRLPTAITAAPRASSALRPAVPAARCFSLLASQHDDNATPADADRAGAAAPLAQALKGLRAGALRAQLGGLPAVPAAAAAAGRGFATVNEITDPTHPAIYKSAPVLGRFCVTAEVVVSKIFPAGFGWQGSSCVAEQLFELGPNDAGFFFVTGVGDMVGVVTGHTLFYWLKKTFDPTINIVHQFQVGWFLGSAAFCSGAMWQPFVNWFQAPGVAFSFTQACAATTIGCGTMFFIGLRAGRQVYPTFMSGMSTQGPTYSNLQGDMQLSLSVGAATGVFVGTDLSYGTPANWMDPVLGIGVLDTDSDFTGMCKAGLSTGIGFAAAQGVANMVIPHNNAWLD